ncbi:hypothetical protein D3C81_1935390 [compost metagenome]
MHHLRLNLVVQRRRRAVEVDIANLIRLQARFVKRLGDGANRPFALRMWRGNVVGIA